MRISDWSSDVCSSDLLLSLLAHGKPRRKQDERQRHTTSTDRCAVAHRRRRFPRGKRRVAPQADRPAVARTGQRKAEHDLWPYWRGRSDERRGGKELGSTLWTWGARDT